MHNLFDYFSCNTSFKKNKKNITANEGYNYNLLLLEKTLSQATDENLMLLKNSIRGVRSYIEENPDLVSDSLLKDIMSSMNELLQPSRETGQLATFKIQKLHYSCRYGLTYFDYVSSTKRYANFAQLIDQASGGRSMTKHKEAVAIVSLGTFFFGLTLLILGLALGVSISHPQIIILMAFSAAGLMTAAVTHLLNYPRSGLAKLLALVADEAFEIENKRLEKYCKSKSSHEDHSYDLDAFSPGSSQ